VGVIVPGVRFVDPAEGVLGLEWIDGHSVRALLQGEPEDEADDDMLEDSTTEPATHDLSIYNATAGESLLLARVILYRSFTMTR
jgi:TP53 regulating kinase-like protein